MDQDPQFFCALGFMLTAAVVVVHVGSFRGLTLAQKGSRLQETLSAADAAKFPLTGSLVLFSLYVALRFIDKSVISMIMSGYLGLMSVFALSSFVRPYVGGSYLVGCVCLAIGGSYLHTKHWVLNNTLSIALSVVAVESVQLGSYVTSAILLVGLFIYDIFWVFGTDVMVTVATSIDGPIKLVFPQTIFGDHTKKSLLGLGDIVIPGFFVAHMLIFSRLKSADRTNFYYNVSIIAYFLSLVNTMFVMVFFQAAQPALLYIVPWLLISTGVAALAKGEFGLLWGFDSSELHHKSDEEETHKEEVTFCAFLKELTLDFFGQLPEEGEVAEKKKKSVEQSRGKNKIQAKSVSSRATPSAATTAGSNSVSGSGSYADDDDDDAGFSLGTYKSASMATHMMTAPTPMRKAATPIVKPSGGKKKGSAIPDASPEPKVPTKSRARSSSPKGKKKKKN